MYNELVIISEGVKNYGTEWMNAQLSRLNSINVGFEVSPNMSDEYREDTAYNVPYVHGATIQSILEDGIVVRGYSTPSCRRDEELVFIVGFDGMVRERKSIKAEFKPDWLDSIDYFGAFVTDDVKMENFFTK